MHLPLKSLPVALLLATLAACGSDPSGPVAPDEETIANLTISERPAAPTLSVAAGYTPLDLGETRDGVLFVPSTYNPGISAPLIVLLHGAGGSWAQWASSDIEQIAEQYGMVILALDSRATTWDVALTREYRVDVAFMRAALAFTFARVNVNPSRVAIGGFSDGAAEALGVGIANAGLFNAVIAFSPGLLETPFKRGEPRIYIAHGTQDAIVPYQTVRDLFVPKLRANGMTVQFILFQGDHEMPVAVRQEAFSWWLEAP